MGNPTITMLQPYKRQIFCMLKWNGQICPAQIHHFYYNMSSHPNLPNKQIEILRSGFYVADSHPFFNRWPSFKRFGQLIPSIPRLHQMRSAFSILIDFPKYYTWGVGPKFAPKASPNAQLLCFPNKEIQRIKAYQKATKGYKNKLKKKTQTWESGKSFLFIPIDIDTLKRMGWFLFEQHQKSVQIHTAKTLEFQLPRSFWKDAWINLWPSACPYRPYGRDPLSKSGLPLCQREQRGSMPDLRGGDGTALHGSPWLQMILFLVDWKNSVVYDLKNKNTSGTLSYPRAIIFK